MKIKGMVFWGVILALFLVPVAANAATFSINITGIKEHDGGAIADGASVTAYYGPSRPDSSGNTTGQVIIFRDAQGGDITSNLRITGGAIVFSGLTDQIPVGGGLTLRIWDSAERFSTSAFYIDLGYTVAGTPTEDWNLAFSAAGYICNYYPPQPTIAMNSTNPEKLSRRGMTGSVFDLQLNYVISAGTAYNAFADAYEVQVVKKDNAGDSWPAWQTAKDSITYFDNSTNSTPTNDFYVGGKFYRLRTRGTNHLGPPVSQQEIGWSDPIEYQSAGGGGPLTQSEIIYTFEVHATGVNTFAVPFNLSAGVTRGLGGAAITPFSTINDLIKEINAQSGPGTVSVFGWWDQTEQRHVGLTSIPTNAYNPADGSIDPAACRATGMSAADILGTGAPIVPNRAYQVSVRTPVPAFKLAGYK
jgi:hypothetical protein